MLMWYILRSLYVFQLNSKKPPNLNFTDEFGNTALHIAAQTNQKEVAVFLLQSGVNVTAKNAKGR